ncbi:hypothetical protein AMECASPLE_008091, partial [Ameca splendens]
MSHVVKLPSQLPTPVLLSPPLLLHPVGVAEELSSLTERQTAQLFLLDQLTGQSVRVFRGGLSSDNNWISVLRSIQHRGTDTIMDSFWALVCAAASVLVLRSSACKDAQTCLQREVTIFHGQELQEPDLFALQREVDLSELLNTEDFPIMQEMVKPQWEKELSASEDKPPPRSWPSFGPRSFPPGLQYAVQFPLGQPTPDNIQAICVHADHRPRYPDSYFPPSGFGKQRRMATAVNNAESWFSTCCQGNETWGTEGTLCCATQAWQRSVELFCEEDSSVKDRLYDCCRQTGVNRLGCFNDDAPNPSYKPTEELPVEAVGSVENFRFSQNTCP